MAEFICTTRGKVRPIHHLVTDIEFQPYMTLIKEVLIRQIKDFVYALKECKGKDLLTVALHRKQVREEARRKFRDARRYFYHHKTLEAKNNYRRTKIKYSQALKNHELVKNGLLAKHYLFSDSYQCKYHIFNYREICKLLIIDADKLRELLKEIEEKPEKLAALFKNQKYFPVRRRHGQ